MNRFTFSVRRVFHRSNQIGILILRSYGLTPSRYDLMMAIACQRQGFVPHADVVTLMGVRGPVISRMVSALVQRGLVVRRRDPRDGRRRLIGITRLGYLALRCAFKRVVRSGFIAKVTLRAITDAPDFAPEEPERAAQLVEQMTDALQTIQNNLDDTSSFRHGDGKRPRPVDVERNRPRPGMEKDWPGDDQPLCDWIRENLPLPPLIQA